MRSEKEYIEKPLYIYSIHIYLVHPRTVYIEKNYEGCQAWPGATSLLTQNSFQIHNIQFKQ